MPDDTPALPIGLGPGGEFDVIRRLTTIWGDAARGLGDDCAVLTVPPGELLVTSTDTSVEDVHFRADWLTAREIGWRAATAAASDLAAAGAHPLGMLLALTVPERWRGDLDALAAGVGDAARAHSLPILGGDLSRGATLSLAATVFGSALRPLSRAGAKAGGIVCVTGALGGPGAALASWLAGEEPTPEARGRFAHPVARLGVGNWLAAHGALAAIDISDGLAADAAHLAHASGVRITIDLRAVPTLGGCSAVDAVASGEEYELAVILPASADVPTLAAELDRAHGVRLSVVGRASPGAPGVDLVDGTGRVDLPRGHDHFPT